MTILLLDFGRELRGGQKQTLWIGCELFARGHRVALAARPGSPLAEAAGTWSPPLPVFPIRGRGESDPRSLLDLRSACARFVPDLLYANDASSHGTAVWSGCARRFPLVVHRRVAFDVKGGPLGQFKYRAARRVLAVSKAAAEAVARAGLTRERIGLVPVAIPERAFVERASPPPPPVRILHVGAFDGRKGQELVVRAVAELFRRGVDARARFAGEGPERPRVEELAERLGVGDRCEFLGYVETIPQEFARTHLFLLPSEKEGSPTALLEALASGCPALVHDAGGSGELVRASGSGRAIRGLDPSVWAEAVLETLASPDTMSRWADAGRRFARSHTVPAVVGRLEAEFVAATRAV